MPAAAPQRSAATARAGPRWIHLSLACLATFALTRLLGRFGAAPPRASSAGLEPAAAAAPHASAFAAARRLRRDEALAPRADQPPVTAAAATPTAAPLAVPSRDGRRAGAGKFAPPATPVGGYFIVIGFPIGIDERNRDRRALLRELWYPEYDNIGKTVRVEFVIGLLTYQGDGHEDRIVNELYDGARRRTLERPHHSMLICSHPRPPFAQIRRAYRARRPGARQRARSHARPIPRRPEVHRRKDCGVVPAGGGDAPQDAVSCGRSRAGHRACEAASECVVGAAQLLH